jgi:acylphosphatase
MTRATLGSGTGPEASYGTREGVSFPPCKLRYIGIDGVRVRGVRREVRTMAKQEAIEAIVTGNDQKVGFRALVMKQAIEYNLAGSAKNDANDIVRFTLQGDRKRIDSALATIQEGTKKSSDIKITTASAAIEPALDTFTIVDWTSSSRNITDKYNLVFKLRANDSAISPTDAKAAWHHILETTLNADDLKKLQRDD